MEKNIFVPQAARVVPKIVPLSLSNGGRPAALPTQFPNLHLGKLRVGYFSQVFEILHSHHQPTLNHNNGLRQGKTGKMGRVVSTEQRESLAIFIADRRLLIPCADS
jgi:hypothetical protein